MIRTIQITIDRAGRVVIPKTIRQEAGLAPGMPLEIRCRDGRVTIEPAAEEVELVTKGRVRVAVSKTGAKPLSSETVRRVQRDLREHKG
ncbi:MAG: AbrB/MazE/SpoVT family DNA-binding domain-containing protein [Deltaproteobacteria bacterium]|nr:AbrB/MazE/SpoVT family DNA-binding domain-containing protein [Deltaproteobacteria bacterium]